MATEYTFNGRLISLPGVYAETKSGVNNQPLDFSYGNILVIDKDPNNPFGGGSGIAGAINSGDKSVYPFDNLEDFRKFIRGGALYDNAEPMFRPAGAGSQGISKLYYVRAFTTTAASKVITWTGGGANGGVLTFQNKTEGLAGNGVEGNETKAKQSLLVTVVGSAADTCEITANGTALGSYIQVAAASLASTASGIAAVINANTFAGIGHGYTATSSGSQVIVSAPENLGTTGNGYTFVVADTGTLTATVGAATMAGGVDGTKLTRGFAITMAAGSVDIAKFVLKFWRGSFTGLDSDGDPYNGIEEASTTAELISESPEFNNIQEIIDWAKVNADFANSFNLTSSIVNGTGVVDAADLAATIGNNLFAGGTQVYNTARIDELLDVVKPVDYTFAYTLDSGANVQSVDNGKILASFVNGGAKYEKFLVIGGGNDADTFVSQSKDAAIAYNSDRVILVHGGCFITYQNSGTGLKQKNSAYKAANVLGRMCGLSPQTPITFKNLGYASEVHALSDSEKETALKAGVLVTGYDYELQDFTIVAGVNTLQRNSYIVNTDGTSHLISVKRIAAQLNKELEVNMKISLLGNQTIGPNRATLSKSVVTNWVKNYLNRKTATATEDNLIISFQDITASYDQDLLRVRYSFVPNFEINKIFITGLIIDPAL